MDACELKTALFDLVKKTEVLEALTKAEEFTAIGSSDALDHVAAGVVATKIALILAEYYNVDPDILVKLLKALRHSN